MQDSNGGERLSLEQRNMNIFASVIDVYASACAIISVFDCLRYDNRKRCIIDTRLLKNRTFNANPDPAELLLCVA